MKIELKVELIKNYLNENKMSKNAFCRKCKINIATLNRILTNSNVNLVSLFKITRVIGIRLHELF